MKTFTDSSSVEALVEVISAERLTREQQTDLHAALMSTSSLNHKAIVKERTVKVYSHGAVAEVTFGTRPEVDSLTALVASEIATTLGQPVDVIAR